MKYVERKVTNVDLTLNKKEALFADNVSLVTTIAKIRLLYNRTIWARVYLVPLL